MSLAQLFRSYELLAERAGTAFDRMQASHAERVRCARGCADCCHAVFGLFLIEAAYLKEHFGKLPVPIQREALLRCREMDRCLTRLEVKLKLHEDDPGMQDVMLARERIACPLLDEQRDCVLYPHRPVTCRAYGIPTRVRGKGRVCGQSGFEGGQTYPVFDLDGAHRELHVLSKELLSLWPGSDPERASLLVSVSKALSTPLETLVGAGCPE